MMSFVWWMATSVDNFSKFFLTTTDSTYCPQFSGKLYSYHIKLSVSSIPTKCGICLILNREKVLCRLTEYCRRSSSSCFSFLSRALFKICHRSFAAEDVCRDIYSENKTVSARRFYAFTVRVGVVNRRVCPID